MAHILTKKVELAFEKTLPERNHWAGRIWRTKAKQDIMAKHQKQQHNKVDQLPFLHNLTSAGTATRPPPILLWKDFGVPRSLQNHSQHQCPHNPKPTETAAGPGLTVQPCAQGNRRNGRHSQASQLWRRNWQSRSWWWSDPTWPSNFPPPVGAATKKAASGLPRLKQQRY